MANQLITTKSLVGRRAVTQSKGRNIGKVRHFVFHPTEKRVIGFLVKRPDAALMFHRKDMFVAIGGYHIEDGEVVVHGDPTATDHGAIRALGVNWDSCVLWVGMPVMAESGEFMGYVDVVTFDAQTGVVSGFTTDSGAANDVILGKRAVPARYVRGFKRGIGAAVAPVGSNAVDGEEGEPETGAILVADEALNLPVEGGVAAAAGKATAVATHKIKQQAQRAKAAASQQAQRAKETASQQAQRAKPAVDEAAKRAGAAVDAGSFAVGRQLGRASGMFSAFKEEFDKASKGTEE